MKATDPITAGRFRNITQHEDGTSTSAMEDCLGLTKREWLIGIIANGICSNSKGHNCIDDVAISAIACADEIIKRLNEESGE